jgi:hypothetical protein
MSNSRFDELYDQLRSCMNSNAFVGEGATIGEAVQDAVRKAGAACGHKECAPGYTDMTDLTADKALELAIGAATAAQNRISDSTDASASVNGSMLDLTTAEACQTQSRLWVKIHDRLHAKESRNEGKTAWMREQLKREDDLARRAEDLDRRENSLREDEHNATINGLDDRTAG